MSWEGASKEASANAEGDLQSGSGLIYTLKFKDKSVQLGTATVMDSVQKVKRKQLVFNNQGGFQGLKRIFFATIYFSFIDFNCPGRRIYWSEKKTNSFSPMFPAMWLSCPVTLLYLLQQLNLYSMTL